MGTGGPCTRPRQQQPRYEVADIFRVHGPAYRAAHRLTPEQRWVMTCIEACRTPVLGGHLDVCPDCGNKRPSYNSCRNRHCPKCQALDQQRWLQARKERILPVPYFHVVFTLPGALKPLALKNRRGIYDLLFTAATTSLLELGRDPKHLGGQLGITAVLHSWARDLRFHPHLHCVVTAGGLTADGQRWVETPHDDFLFPVKVIGRLFRGKFIHGLKQRHQRADLDLRGGDEHMEVDIVALCNQLFQQSWVVYAKRPFAGPEQVFSYLGRYTHRVAISNHRLLSVTHEAVTFATRDGNTATLTPHEFIRRFLQHVLPKGFSKIRHYGLLASTNVKTKLQHAFRLLQPADPADPADPSDPSDPSDSNDQSHDISEPWQHLLQSLTGIDISICPVCGGNRVHRIALPEHHPLGRSSRCARAPPWSRSHLAQVDNDIFPHRSTRAG